MGIFLNKKQWHHIPRKVLSKSLEAPDPKLDFDIYTLFKAEIFSEAAKRKAKFAHKCMSRV